MKTNAALKESEHNLPLRTEGFDAHKAAVRLTMYWKYRKNIFDERWLLPMAQTGRGALTLEDIALLRAGSIQMYQAGPAEHLCVQDTSKLSDIAQEAQRRGWNAVKAQHRCIMYIGTISTDAICQTKGITHVRLVNSAMNSAMSLCGNAA